MSSSKAAAPAVITGEGGSGNWKERKRVAMVTMESFRKALRESISRGEEQHPKAQHDGAVRAAFAELAEAKPFEELSMETLTCRPVYERLAGWLTAEAIIEEGRRNAGQHLSSGTAVTTFNIVVTSARDLHGGDAGSWQVKAWSRTARMTTRSGCSASAPTSSAPPSRRRSPTATSSTSRRRPSTCTTSAR